MFREDISLIIPNLLRWKIFRKGGRADECVGLENRCGETHRGFESHPFHHSGVAQLAEHLTVNQRVIGSIPIAGAFKVRQ